MKGVYGIKVDKCLVYVGQTMNISSRVEQHYTAMSMSKPKENKYYLLKDARSRKHKITFWLLEEVENPEERYKAETKWIKALRPCLNSKDNGGLGQRLTAQEFYEYIYNNQCEFEASQIKYNSWRK